MKGISPLIATVLLIAFTITVGTVISLWLKQLATTTSTQVSEQTQKEIVCSYGGVSLDELEFCDPYLSGNIENTGDIILGEITLLVVYSDYNLKIPLCKSDSKIVNCSSSNLTTSPREIIPFNLSVDANFKSVRVLTNCSNVYDEVKSYDVSTC